RRQRKNQPPAPRIHRRKSQHISKKCPVRLRILAVYHDMRPKNHFISLRPFLAAGAYRNSFRLTSKTFSAYTYRGLFLASFHRARLGGFLWRKASRLSSAVLFMLFFLPFF